MVLEESDSGALGGDAHVYAGRNIDFGFPGRYLTAKVEYDVGWGESAEGGSITRYKKKMVTFSNTKWFFTVKPDV